MNPGKTIVIGGGAAGLFAAGRAAERGAEVVLLEKMAQNRRKIFIIGKGIKNINKI
jgi:predicted flavoprotein YhiN